MPKSDVPFEAFAAAFASAVAIFSRCEERIGFSAFFGSTSFCVGRAVRRVAIERFVVVYLEYIYMNGRLYSFYPNADNI